MQRLAFHMMHFKLDRVQSLCDESQRNIDHTADGRINFSKTEGNYQAINGVAMDKKDYGAVIEKVLNDYGITKVARGRSLRYIYSDGKAVRKDANILTGIVVTLSRESVAQWGPESTRRYFKRAALFLKEMFGNCVDDVVHVDEDDAGIHLHFYAISIKKDKNGIDRLNTRDLWKRKQLIRLHTEFAKEMVAHGFPIERGIEGSNIRYRNSFRDRKHEELVACRNIGYIEKSVERVHEAAEYQEAKAGVFGIGAKKERVLLSVDDYNTLISMAKDSAHAIEELETNRRRIDQGKRLARLKEEKARLQDDLEKAAAREKELLDKIAREKQHQQKAIAAAEHKAREAVINEVASKYGELIKLGNFVEPVVKYVPLMKKLRDIISEARAMDKAAENKKAAPVKSKPKPIAKEYDGLE